MKDFLNSSLAEMLGVGLAFGLAISASGLTLWLLKKPPQADCFDECRRRVTTKVGFAERTLTTEEYTQCNAACAKLGVK